MDFSAVPVLMYHSVKYQKRQNWIHKHLSLKLENFERHLKFFNDYGIKSYFLDAISDHLEGKSKLPARSVALTFDDGYRDNWVFAFPLLMKYKIKATIWVNPEFVDDDDDKIYPNLQDYWSGKVTLAELNKIDGFLNWEELRLMEKSGLIDIQSHTMSHDKYPISKKIVDFISPNKKVDWMMWNLRLIEKKDYLVSEMPEIPLGYPIYESEKGNIARKLTEDGKLSSYLTEFVKNNGNEEFFLNPDWKEQLFSISKTYLQNNDVEYLQETEKEYNDRMKYELQTSKDILSEKLNKKIEFLCWPFGGWDENTIRLADYYGYRSTTAKGQKNVFNKKLSNRIDRFSLESPRFQNLLFPLYATYKFLKYKLSA